MLATALYRGCVVVWAGAMGALAWEIEDTVKQWKPNVPILDKAVIWSPDVASPNVPSVVQQITVITITSTSAVVTYPKITAAPLMRRKLGSYKWDSIHEHMQAQKRDGESCGIGLKLCPQSLNGGCCPNDRECGPSSCLAASTSTAAQVGCGSRADLFACSLDVGGGCCPLSHKCLANGCSPLPGVTQIETCSANFSLCPAAMNGGCCKSGLACGYDGCYSTEVRSFTLTQTITTTDASSNKQTITKTITSATTPAAPLAPTNLDSNIVPKVSAVPGGVPKTSSSSDTSKHSSGLTTAQLGGIIGGAVGLLIAIIIASYLIIRRLNKVIKVNDANSRSKDSSTGPPKPVPRQADIDAMSVDPLMMTPSEIQFPSATSTPYEADSSPVYRNLYSPQSPPHSMYQRGYNAVASSEAGSNPGWFRQSPVDSTPQMSQVQNGAGSYFDIPPKDGPNRSPRHSRHWSNASGESEIVELDAGTDGDRRSSLQRALQGVNRLVSMRRGSTGNHSRSSSQDQLTGGPTRSDWQQPTNVPNASGPLGHSLGHIAEAGESRIAVDTVVNLPGPTHSGHGFIGHGHAIRDDR